ncbi:HlyD family efflux transporter periplasmic adaptor subunit [Candidatus Kaiserbacteria bacterium]|nr:HlyD family efflux transporter periplasmic adaptor subunit [Candidatus Kaiserbacteria bacterium]
MRFILNAHRVLLSLNYREINWKSWKTWTIVGAILAVLIGLLSYNALSGGTEETVETGPRQVRVARVGDILRGSGSLSVIAEVQSVSEAKISPESGGRVARVRASLGDRVAAGQVLAEIENDSQRAAVLQAEGAYDAAKASLQKVEGGTRAEQLAILESALASAKGSAVTALLTAYASVDSAVNDTADQMFTGVELGNIQFTPSTSNQAREADLETRRGKLTLTLDRQEEASKSVSVSSDLSRELQLAEEEVREVRTFIDIILAALADAFDSPTVSSSEISAYKADATASRTTLTAALSGITSARNSIQTSEKNLEQGETGAQSEDVAGAEAAVKQAQGSYNAALANLEKTILRSPIAGTLNNFTIKLGDTVAPAQEVAIVSNNNALEGVAYLTEEDKERVRVGQKVKMEGNIEGTITKIAPALDPVTRRVEIRIGLPASATNTLTNGQSLRVELDSAAPTPTKATEGPLSIPITALRMEASRNAVFTVVESKIVTKEITIGKLSGEYVQVTAGIDASTEIVVDARGLKEGDVVTASSF